MMMEGANGPPAWKSFAVTIFVGGTLLMMMEGANGPPAWKSFAVTIFVGGSLLLMMMVGANGPPAWKSFAVRIFPRFRVPRRREPTVSCGFRMRQNQDHRPSLAPAARSEDEGHHANECRIYRYTLTSVGTRRTAVNAVKASTVATARIFHESVARFVILLMDAVEKDKDSSKFESESSEIFLLRCIFTAILYYRHYST
jgi:hypothetical protein